MRDPSDPSDGNDHEKVWEILPWYVNGTLEGHEHEFVARHILSCQSCADEVVRCQSIATAVRSSEEAAWMPSPEHLARLMERIDRGSASAAPERWRIRVREWIEKIRLAFQETPSLFRWALAAQTAAIVLLAAATIWQASVAPSLLYQTLSDAGSGPEPGRVHLQVVFADDTTEREIRTLLSGIGATIVAGPSPMAVYTVALAAADHEAPGQTQERLALLRAHPKVRLAEAKQP
jgi:anti-sigma factor RsiW